MTCLHPSSITAGTATARSDHRPADLTLASVLDYHGHGHPSQKCAVRTCIRPRLPQALRLGHGQPFVRVRELASVLDYHRHCDLGRGAQGHLPCVLHPSSITTGTATAQRRGPNHDRCPCIRPRLPQALRLCHRILDCIPTVLASVLDCHRHCDDDALGEELRAIWLASVLDCHRHCDSARTNCSLHPSSIATGTATNRVVGMQA